MPMLDKLSGTTQTSSVMEPLGGCFDEALDLETEGPQVRKRLDGEIVLSQPD